MEPLAFVGDELTATGYRLAGARVYTPSPDEVLEALRDARARAAVVLIAAPLAALLPARLLDEALASAAPLALVVDDLRGGMPPPDLEAAMRRALGVEGA